MSRTDDDTWDITEGVGATAAGWRSPFLDDHPVRAEAMAAYTASRTKFFDDFFTTAGANGVDQAVLLAAGLDTRAWRLRWIDGTTVYEIDQPKVLEFKDRVLAQHRARPAAQEAGNGKTARSEAGSPMSGPDVTRLWYTETRTDVAQSLTEHGWAVTTIAAADLTAHYQRPAPDTLEDTVPDTVLIDARKL